MSAVEIAKAALFGLGSLAFGLVSLATFLWPFQVMRAYLWFFRAPQRWTGFEIPVTTYSQAIQYVISNKVENPARLDEKARAWLQLRAAIRLVSGAGIILALSFIGVAIARLIQIVIAQAGLPTAGP